MARLIGIDFGLKRIGIAETDDLQIVASARSTVENSDIIPYLKDYLARYDVEAIVLGLPRRLDGSNSHITDDILSFRDVLENEFSIPVHLMDERFTSKMASIVIAKSGKSKKARQDKRLIDKVSATIILQSYLHQKDGPNFD